MLQTHQDDQITQFANLNISRIPIAGRSVKQMLRFFSDCPNLSIEAQEPRFRGIFPRLSPDGCQFTDKIPVFPSFQWMELLFT